MLEADCTQGGWLAPCVVRRVEGGCGHDSAPPQVPVLLMKVEYHPRFRIHLSYNAVLSCTALPSEYGIVIKVRAPVLLLTAMFVAATGSALVI